MKVNVFFFGIGIVMALLLAYWAFSIAEGQANDKICGIGSAICFSATLAPLFGIAHKAPRIDVNLRVLSAMFFLLFLISHFCFAVFGVRMPYYVIANALMFLLFITIYYAIGKKEYL